MTSPPRQNQRKEIIIGIGLALALGLAWYLLTLRIISELTLPSPASVWQAFKALQSRLPESAWVTFKRVLAGWSLGSILGVGLGLGMTYSRLFYSIANPLIELVRPIPPVALAPFFIIWFGIDNSGQIALVTLGCLMVLTVNTFVAVHNLPPIYIRAALALGASRRQIYRTVILPAILPALISGFRIAAALAFGLAVAAEFMGAQSGLGYMIMVARRTLNSNTILLGIFILGGESYLLDSGIRLLSRYLCRWSETPFDALQPFQVK